MPMSCQKNRCKCKPCEQRYRWGAGSIRPTASGKQPNRNCRTDASGVCQASGSGSAALPLRPQSRVFICWNVPQGCWRKLEAGFPKGGWGGRKPPLVGLGPASGAGVGRAQGGIVWAILIDKGLVQALPMAAHGWGKGMRPIQAQAREGRRSDREEGTGEPTLEGGVSFGDQRGEGRTGEAGSCPQQGRLYKLRR